MNECNLRSIHANNDIRKIAANWFCHSGGGDQDIESDVNEIEGKASDILYFGSWDHGINVGGFIYSNGWDDKARFDGTSWNMVIYEKQKQAAEDINLTDID